MDSPVPDVGVCEEVPRRLHRRRREVSPLHRSYLEHLSPPIHQTLLTITTVRRSQHTCAISGPQTENAVPSTTSPKPSNDPNAFLSAARRRAPERPQLGRKNLKEPESRNATISRKTLDVRSSATPGKNSPAHLKVRAPNNRSWNERRPGSARPEPNRTEQDRTRPNANKHDLPPTAGNRAQSVEILPLTRTARLGRPLSRTTEPSPPP